LSNFFIYVDFGEKANKFLQSCGVKCQPLAIDYAELLVKSSSEIWNLLRDYTKYATILGRIALDYYSIAYKNPGLITRMKQEPILLAVTKGNSDNAQFCLASSKDIFINDDTIYQQVFNPLTAPEDSYLKGLYKVHYVAY